MGGVRLINIAHCYHPESSFRLQIDHLEISDGEIIALVGESGCGKTTLLRAIAGLESPQAGRIIIDQQEVYGPKINLPPEKRNIGLVFQDYALFPHLTVGKNITFGLLKLQKEEQKKRLEDILALTHLAEFIQRYPHELSGGQQQRVALARALICQPEVLLLDEPFSNMDELLKKGLRPEIKELVRATRTTTIMVTHDIRDAFAIAGRVIILRAGRVEQDGSRDELQSNPINDYVRLLVNTSN